MAAHFITATGTDIGKTYVTAALIRALRQGGRKVAALKPVISGFLMAEATQSDAGRLLAALGQDVTEDNLAGMSPWRFAAPLSPDMAARREERPIDVDALIRQCRQRIAATGETLLIEGVGGVMVPLDDHHTVVDWIAGLEIPAILVAGSYLGSLSHTLSALEVLSLRGITTTAIVVSETPESSVPLDETLSTIARFAAPVEVIGLRREEASTEHIAGIAQLVSLL